MLKLFRLLLYICFQILLIISSIPNILCYLLSGLSFIFFLILVFKHPGNLNTNQFNSEQKVQVFTPQSDKQFHFTDRTNKTAAKILQSSLVIYKKKHLNSLKEEESIKEEKQIEQQINPNQDQEQQEKVQDPQSTQQLQQIVYLEQLYCVTCLIDQILRCRHCKFCNACIITYDHHNFFIGKCIGEKNKCFFLLYLILQSKQLLFTLFYLQVPFRQNKFTQFGFKFIIVLILGYILMLLIYHLYLVLTNQTYAEKRFRHKLSYMKYAKEEILKPFDGGCMLNIKQFLISSFQKQPYKWTFIQQ